ncbi:MAG: dipeptidase [Oscillospiraceae bacterium]|nr:dipeptidase [Oscillospiraceae bacterium]
MNYTDLHCDTAFEIYKSNRGLNKNKYHVDMEKAKIFDRYSQIFAIWSDNDKNDDENYDDFFKIRNYLTENLSENNISLCKTGLEYKKSKNKNRAFLAVEGGKLLSGDISRLDVLYKNDVRFLTLVWNGICKIGGAFNTDEGLTDFGKKIVRKCEELGIVIDLSHSSDKTVSDVFEISKKPVIASHSSSRSVISCHKRNLADEQFLEIKKRGGIVGISLCRGHIADENGLVTIKDIIKHIDYYMSLGGENIICFGCDFDGAEIPEEVENITGVMKICDELKKIGYKDTLIENIMYKNADNFIIKNL